MNRQKTTDRENSTTQKILKKKQFCRTEPNQKLTNLKGNDKKRKPISMTKRRHMQLRLETENM